MGSDSAAAASAQGEKLSASSSQPDEGSAPFATANADILRAAGVTEEAVKAYEAQAEPPPAVESAAEPKEEQQQELPGTEKEPAPAKDAERAEEDGTTEESEEVAEPQPEKEPGEEETTAPGEEETSEEVEKPGWYQKRLAKWGRQKERLQDEIDDLKDRLAGKQETQPQAQEPGGDTWGGIQTLPDLQRTVEMQRQIRDWCMENPDGAVLNEGKPQERVVPPEEVRKTLIGATRILEDAPRKAGEIQQRQQMRELAQSEWPELFDSKSEVYQTSQAFLQQYPAIAQNPNRDLILGLMVEGWKPFKARMDAKAKGQAPAPANNGETLPEALKRKIPPIPKTTAPNPPRGSRVPSPIKDAAAAVERIVRDGATPESIHDAIAAIERQNAVAGATKRTPAPV